MALRIKTIALLSLILLIIPLFSGKVEGVKNKSSLINQLQEDGKRMMIIKSRKLSSVGASVLDYDDAEPNPRHDPRRKRSNP